MARALLEDGDGTPSFRPVGLLLPYLWPKGRWDLKTRVIIALLCMVLAKIATVTMPWLNGLIVDSLRGPAQAAGVIFSLIVAYTLSRIMMQGFAQLRDGVFARVAGHAQRQVGVSTFAHVHTLSLRFHLERKTGGLSRIIDRGTKGIDTLLTFVIFSIFPTILELALDAAILWLAFGFWFAAVTIVMVAAYIWFTFAVTRWRIKFRREMNESDTEASTKAVDSLINYETVKYFNAEAHETKRYDGAMSKFAEASIQTQTSLSVLNTGQAAIVALGLMGVLMLSAHEILAGRMSVGAMVAATGYLVQLYMPLNLLGTVYREITQALVDMDAMFSLLHRPQEVEDKPDAKPLAVSGGAIHFDNVVFRYDPERTVLKGISFTVPAGKTVAIVGPSGAGKSTISRILYRFYDIAEGSVTIDGQDIRDVTQGSLRAAIGIVPQDTVLFNDSVRYNIAYGRIGASDEEVEEAARHAQIDTFIREQPKAYDTMVGERGLKLSGGEKQRVAIARTILKNPPILMLDEATSALDTHTEREIQAALHEVSKNRTTLVIAHRLSTVVDADEILVLEKGEIVERGRHDDLVAAKGAYAAMWNKQKRAEVARERIKKIEADPDTAAAIARSVPAGE